MSFFGLVDDSKISGEFTADSAAHIRALISDVLSEYQVRVRVVEGGVILSADKKEQQ